MRAMSWSLVILLTVSEAASLRSCRAALRSFQNGIFTSRPPPAASASNSGALSTIPHSPNALSSAVRSIAYFSNSVGMMISATAVFGISVSGVVALHAPLLLSSRFQPRGQLRVALLQAHLLGEIPRFLFERVFHETMRLGTSTGGVAGSTAASVGFE